VAQGEFAELVDGVVADAEVAGGGVRWAGFGAGLVGLLWCGARWLDPRCLGDREMTADDFEDNHPCLGHEPRLSPMTRLIGVLRRCHP
jgi:hypothetical protein